MSLPPFFEPNSALWAVWPDGHYCSVEEIPDVHWGDDYQIRPADAYAENGAPIFIKGTP